jgi:hypothetical protein
MKRLLASVTMLSLLAATPAVAQAPRTAAAAQPASFPDTPLGRLGQELVDLVNQGDSTAIHDFLAAAVRRSSTAAARRRGSRTRSRSCMRRVAG